MQTLEYRVGSNSILIYYKVKAKPGSKFMVST